ncbi:MAG: bifunctional nuclease family protein [Flexilinea sp.]|nr:bifunctional nuclease family protein [Flexilinea sp.]
MSEKAEVTIESLRVSLTSQHRIILLKEKDGVLSLPLFIGQFEAESIVLALQDIEISRPQPHDLMRSIIKALDCQTLYAEITEMKAATFYAVLVLRNASGGEVRIDCRPSDAIAIALRAHVPVYVDRYLMDTCGIRPETDVRRKNRPQQPGSDSADDEDLSAFKDFLDNFGA